jgi:serine/threonine protein kinase/tetratricopeptide (TPR) repeat protein
MSQEGPEQPGSPGWQRMTSGTLRELEELAHSRVGQTLAGRFHIQRLVAIGGMAAVYEAIQSPLMRRVAVKILHPSEIEAGRRDYFLREANAVAQLRHPNIISIVDFGQEPDGTLFLAMEMVPGMTFGELLGREYPLEYPRLISIAEQVCLALEVAHRAGVVHCDMKPSNIMIESVPGNPDHVKVLDFGISRSLKKEAGQSALDKQIIGSYYYMAPEQILGDSISPQTDVYGLGVVLFTSLTAAYPFNEADDARLMDAIIKTPPPMPSKVRPELLIPPALDGIVVKALAKDPADRFQSCAELRRALLRFEESAVRAPGLSDTPHSLEILLPEDELFEVEIDLDSAMGADSGVVDEEPAINLPTFGPLPAIPADLGSQPLNISFPQPELMVGPEAPLDESLRFLSGRAPVIGRRRQFADLQRAALLTRRGVVSTHVTGAHGGGASFFVTRALEVLRSDLHATILHDELSPSCREYPLQALYQLVCGAVDEYETLVGVEAGPEGETPLARRRRNLVRLGMGRFEAASLRALLDRYGSTDPHLRNYENGPLRSPETRVALLNHAFAELVRLLVVLGRERSSGGAHRAPLVLTLDGWEHCDPVSRTVVRRVLTQCASLPLLFIAVTAQDANSDAEYFPEEYSHPHASPYDDDRGWDLRIHVPPYTLPEVREYVQHRVGRPVEEALLARLTAASHGNALILKELTQMLTGVTPMPGDSGPSWSPGLLPETVQRLFAQQIDRLGRDGKMLLAVCTLVGPTFTEAALRGVMPDEFDVGGTLAELIGGRILEAGPDNVRLRFRFPQMREISLKRLHPRLRRGLHQRIAGLLRERRLPLDDYEADFWLARHTLKGGDPVGGIDVLLDTGVRAREAGEPHLALRRCRQVEQWIHACRTRRDQTGDESGPGEEGDPTSLDPEVAAGASEEELEILSVRNTIERFISARRLGLSMGHGPESVIPERLPAAFLDEMQRATHIPAALRARAALEVGRYLAALERHADARQPFQFGAVLAQEADTPEVLVALKLELVVSLHKAKRLSRAAELAGEALAQMRKPGFRTVDPELRLSRPLDQLAKICIERRQYPRAEHYLDQARSIADTDGDLDRLGEIHLHYAALYRAQNKNRRTYQALVRALEMTQLNHDLRAKVRVLYNLGTASALLGKRSEARRFLSDASEVAINLGWTDFIALINGQLKRV